MHGFTNMIIHLLSLHYLFVTFCEKFNDPPISIFHIFFLFLNVKRTLKERPFTSIAAIKIALVIKLKAIL